MRGVNVAQTTSESWSLDFRSKVGRTRLNLLGRFEGLSTHILCHQSLFITREQWLITQPSRYLNHEINEYRHSEKRQPQAPSSNATLVTRYANRRQSQQP